MREIKFRIYDKELKESHIEELQDLCEDDYWYDGETEVWVVLKDCNSKQERFVALQYTGLEDKNGIEIYEGDILQQIHYVFSNDEYDYKGFKKLIIQVLWGQKEAAFIFKVIKKIDIEMPKDYKEPYREVIGNIYDNPELLEV